MQARNTCNFLCNHTSLLNVWSLLCYGRIRSYATLIADELHILQYAHYYGVFEMLDVDKMEHWGSSGVQKNDIVFKINWKHHKNAKRINKASNTLQKQIPYNGKFSRQIFTEFRRQYQSAKIKIREIFSLFLTN